MDDFVTKPQRVRAVKWNGSNLDELRQLGIEISASFTYDAESQHLVEVSVLAASGLRPILRPGCWVAVAAEDLFFAEGVLVLDDERFSKLFEPAPALIG